MAENTLSTSAESARKQLLEHVEKLADNHPNRIELRALLKVAITPERAQMVFEVVEAQDFLDPEREPGSEDRYAWDLTLYAVNNWALSASLVDEPKLDKLKLRRNHLLRCALDNNFHSWIQSSKDALQGRNQDEASDRIASANKLIEGLVLGEDWDQLDETQDLSESIPVLGLHRLQAILDGRDPERVVAEREAG